MSDTGPDPQPTGRPWPRVSLLRRAGPVVLIAAALVAAGISATVHENKGTSTATPPNAGSGQQIASSTVPLTYAAAAKLGKTATINWGPECDHHTGRLKIPSADAPPCVPVPAPGATNGGATSSGVTADAINLVYYQAQPGGLTSAISAAAIIHHQKQFGSATQIHINLQTMPGRQSCDGRTLENRSVRVQFTLEKARIE